MNARTRYVAWVLHAAVIAVGIGPLASMGDAGGDGAIRVEGVHERRPVHAPARPAVPPAALERDVDRPAPPSLERTEPPRLPRTRPDRPAEPAPPAPRHRDAALPGATGAPRPAAAGERARAPAPERPRPVRDDLERRELGDRFRWESFGTGPFDHEMPGHALPGPGERRTEPGAAGGGPLPWREQDRPQRDTPSRGMGPIGSAKEPPSGSVFDRADPSSRSSGGRGISGRSEQAATVSDIPRIMGRDAAGGAETAETVSRVTGAAALASAKFLPASLVFGSVAVLANEFARQERQREAREQEEQQQDDASTPPRVDDTHVNGEPPPEPRWDPTGHRARPGLQPPQDEGLVGGDGERQGTVVIDVADEAADLEERRGRQVERGTVILTPARDERLTDPPQDAPIH